MLRAENFGSVVTVVGPDGSGFVQSNPKAPLGNLMVTGVSRPDPVTSTLKCGYRCVRAARISSFEIKTFWSKILIWRLLARAIASACCKVSTSGSIVAAAPAAEADALAGFVFLSPADA